MTVTIRLLPVRRVERLVDDVDTHLEQLSQAAEIYQKPPQINKSDKTFDFTPPFQFQYIGFNIV